MTAQEVQDWVDRILGETEEDEARMLESRLTEHVVRGIHSGEVTEVQEVTAALTRMYNSRWWV